MSSTDNWTRLCFDHILQVLGKMTRSASQFGGTIGAIAVCIHFRLRGGSIVSSSQNWSFFRLKNARQWRCSRVNYPQSSSQLHESCTVNGQHGYGKFIFLVRFHLEADLPPNFVTHNLFLQTLKLATSNLVHSLGLGSTIACSYNF